MRPRRDPEQARALILAAADSLLRVERPDQVTLRKIAAAAGISHGLITHHFGTHEELVRAVLDQRNAKAAGMVMERLSQLENQADSRELLEVVLDFLLDPVRARLRSWLVSRQALPVRDGSQLGFLVDLTTARVNLVRERHGLPPYERATIAEVVRVFRAAARGHAEGERTEDGDQRFRATLIAMVEAYFQRPPAQID